MIDVTADKTLEEFATSMAAPFIKMLMPLWTVVDGNKSQSIEIRLTKKNDKDSIIRFTLSGDGDYKNLLVSVQGFFGIGRASMNRDLEYSQVQFAVITMLKEVLVDWNNGQSKDPNLN